MGLIFQSDAAVSFGNELESEEAKLLPIHDEIRCAPFAAAAYEA